MDNILKFQIRESHSFWLDRDFYRKYLRGGAQGRLQLKSIIFELVVNYVEHLRQRDLKLGKCYASV